MFISLSHPALRASPERAIIGKHGSLAHFTPWANGNFAIGSNDRFAIRSGLWHNPVRRDVFTPLQLGATVCIPEPDDIKQPSILAEWIKRQEITVTNLTPAMGQVLGESLAGGVSGRLELLRYVFFVGDVLTRRDVARLSELAPSATVINLYGSTETSRAVSFFIVPSPGQTDSASGKQAQTVKEVLPLGKGIRDVQLLVLNASGGLAGVGEMGEIYFRSPYIAKGYLGDARLTAEQFVINPFTDEADDRLYRTGDLGRYMPDGNVEALGRATSRRKFAASASSWER